MQKNLNSSRMKKHNMKLVLNCIRQHGSISRKQVAKNIGLTSATVTNIVNHFIDHKYVLEIGEVESGPGRKPIMLKLNPTIGYIVGMELNTSDIITVLVDFDGNVVQANNREININEGRKKVIDYLVEEFEKIIQDNHVQKEKILGLGFVSAGPYNQKDGIMINPPNFPGWVNVPIRDILKQRTGVEVVFERESTAAALGEYWFGHASGVQSLFFTNVYNIGLGGGLVINGDIYHGFKDGAGEIGHMVVDIDGAPCACGSNGCLEVMADGEAAIKNTSKKYKVRGTNPRDLGIGSFDDMNLDTVVALAKQGEQIAMESIKTCARYLGIALGNIVTMFSPEMIILGGDFVDKSDLFIKETIAQIRLRPYPQHIDQVKVLTSKLGRLKCAMGGVALIYERMFR